LVGTGVLFAALLLLLPCIKFRGFIAGCIVAAREAEWQRTSQRRNGPAADPERNEAASYILKGGNAMHLDGAGSRAAKSTGGERMVIARLTKVGKN
jgi:hypothetical protein